MSINYSERIPNNVDLSGDRRLQRALESWQPSFLGWWHELGPEGTEEVDVYLRTAVSVEARGWANFSYVKMPDYRWGVFLAKPEADRKQNVALRRFGAQGPIWAIRGTPDRVHIPDTAA